MIRPARSPPDPAAIPGADHHHPALLPSPAAGAPAGVSCVSAGLPDLHRPLLGEQQPGQAGAVGHVGAHLAAQGGGGARAFVAGAHKLDHQIGAEGREASPLLRAECLPALQGHGGGIGAEHRAVGKAEAGGAVEQLEGQGGGASRQAQGEAEAVVAGAGVTPDGSHRDQMAISRQLQNGIGIGLTHQGELLGGEGKPGWQLQGRPSVPAASGKRRKWLGRA